MSEAILFILFINFTMEMQKCGGKRSFVINVDPNPQKMKQLLCDSSIK